MHPSARIVYYDTDVAGQSVLSHSEPLAPTSIKAYWGEVVPAHVSAERMRIDAARVLHDAGASDVLGWARITIHDQGDARAGRSPVFEGAFSVRGINHHVITRDNYLRNRDALDPHPFTPHPSPEDINFDLDTSLVIWRDSDMMDLWEERAARASVSVDYVGELGSGSQPVRCGHDALPWNSDPALNPVLQQSKVDSWYNPFGSMVYGNPFAELLTKRDDIVGSSMSTKLAHRRLVMSTSWFSYVFVHAVLPTPSDREMVVPKSRKWYVTPKLVVSCLPTSFCSALYGRRS